MARNQGNEGGRSRRGFAAMDDAQQRRIASMGGRASARAQGRDEQGQFAGRSASRSDDRSRPNRGRGSNSR